MAATKRWPYGSGTWSRRETLVISDEQSIGDSHETVVSTPLNLIMHLERTQRPVDTIVLEGRFSADAALVMFLREFYPTLQLVQMPIDTTRS